MTPYRYQVAAIQTQLGKGLDVATVPTIPGGEEDADRLTTA